MKKNNRRGSIEGCGLYPVVKESNLAEKMKKLMKVSLKVFGRINERKNLKKIRLINSTKGPINWSLYLTGFNS